MEASSGDHIQAGLILEDQDLSQIQSELMALANDIGK